MQSDDAKYLKRKIRSGSIDVHPTEKALIVNYELEALILGENGDKMLGDKKEHQKIIRLNSLNARTDCAALAREVVQKCSLIHQAKINEVEHLIHYLKNRKETSSALDADSPRSLFSATDINEKPSINNIDVYVENLYEDTIEKIIGSAMILKLAQNPNNLEELANNESALSALARVLREDWKKNMDLATNIIYIFNCFSAYTQFHPLIVQYKIGSLCMELVDHEIRRYETIKEAIEAKKTNSPRSSSPSTVKKRQSMIPIGKRRSESANRLSGSSDDYRKSLPTTPVNPMKGLLDSFDNIDNKKEDELVTKQNQLLKISVNLLLNLAENTRIEEKMRKRNISRMLKCLLSRSSCDLVVLCLKFLRKLSIYKENKDDMAEIGLVESLSTVINITRQDVQVAAYHLLYNLSFDPNVREQMVNNGLLPKFISALNVEVIQEKSLGILYHLSMDDKVKSMFTYTDAIPILMEMIFDTGNQLVVALGVNLALNKRNAEIMAEDNRVQKLLARAFKTQDALLMKMLHNMVMADSVKVLMVEFVGDIAKATTTCESDAFVLECLGILGNLTMPELDYSQVLQQFGLVSWLSRNLQPSQKDDDVLLAAVVMLGTAACDEDCAQLLCKAGIINSLIELLKAKQEDDEMVLQIVYVFYQTVRHDDSREYLIRQTEAPAYLIDLMQDKNKEIARVCDACLDIISGCDVDWKRRIMLDKFRFHNANWLEMVESQSADDSLFAGMEEELPPYLTDDLMQHTMLYQADQQLSVDADDEDPDNLDKPRSRFSRELDIELIDDGNFSSSSD